jgi:hypothetical protein
MRSVASIGDIGAGAEYPSEVTPPPGVDGVHPVSNRGRARASEVSRASGEVLMGKL